MPTLGQYLFSSALPKGTSFKGPVNAKEIQNALQDIARADPGAYTELVSELKRLGDEVATYEGISVGLDDIAPHYATRDPILKAALADIKKAKSVEERRKIILDAQSKVRDAAHQHPGDMTLMAKSGGRGNFNQYMKTVSSPVGVSNYQGHTIPWLITHSYSEGLRPSEYWAAADESRQNTVEGKLQVTEPGEVGKLMIQTMIDQVVTDPDCGTDNGLAIQSTDQGDMVDRYLAKDHGKYPRNTLVTSAIARDIAKTPGTVVIRSPMTCAHHSSGVCQKCMGLDEKGQVHGIGTNVGVRAAQAMSEPLTQMTLSAKHGTRLVGGDAKLRGLQGMKAFTNIPKTFPSAATLASHDGVVTAIKAAPQGGHYVYVDNTEHYVPPSLDLKVSAKQKVEAGDALSKGIPKPDEIVLHKGIGQGRKYYVDHIHEVFKDAGIDMDKRNIELLARAQLNHVQIEHDPEDEFLRTDIVPFNRLRERLEKDTETLPLDRADGRVLAKDYLHYFAGTRLTPTVINALKATAKDVVVTKSPLDFKFKMHPIDQVPLLRPDWMARLSHRRLKDSIEEGATEAQEADLHGLHPVPGFVVGLEFGHHDNGHY